MNPDVNDAMRARARETAMKRVAIAQETALCVAAMQITARYTADRVAAATLAGHQAKSTIDERR
jgi:hypothetical protein